MHPYYEAVEWIKSSNDLEEARTWMAFAGADYGVIHELSHEESLEVVEEAFQRGAVTVEVMGTLLHEPQNSSTDMLLITLPKDTQDREMLFDLESQIASATGFDASVDEGQMYLLLRWT